MAAPLPPRPFTLRAAIILWLVISVLLAVAAGSFIASAVMEDSDRAGFIGLGTLFGALAVLQLILLLPLRRGRRGGRELLSTIGIIVGVPIIVRGTPGLSLVAVAMLVAVLLMWLPQSSDYFQLTQPKAKKRFRLPGSR
ncbi:MULTISPECIES: hypothetical protein [unclassified Arthrobacter]|uniref:hypothetical protein n=1 Tax=unclassified Arthrobacter TaxID=235627 RepID=UPI0006FB3F4A|nr:hypothetical protein [Arthrobacter sp. Leaf234]KQO03732.1 hypothetical protein ASF21_05665 [Arthrobacter sp. Leaf234]